MSKEPKNLQEEILDQFHLKSLVAFFDTLRPIYTHSYVMGLGVGSLDEAIFTLTFRTCEAFRKEFSREPTNAERSILKSLIVVAYEKDEWYNSPTIPEVKAALPPLSDKISHLNCDPEALKNPKFVEAINQMAEKAYEKGKAALPGGGEGKKDAVLLLFESVQHLFDMKKQKGSTSVMKNAWNIVANRLWDAKKFYQLQPHTTGKTKTLEECFNKYWNESCSGYGNEDYSPNYEEVFKDFQAGWDANASQLQGSEWISVQEAPEGSFIVCDSDCSQSYEAYHFLISNEWYHHNKLVKPAYYREWPNPPQSK